MGLLEVIGWVNVIDCPELVVKVTVPGWAWVAQISPGCPLPN